VRHYYCKVSWSVIYFLDLLQQIQFHSKDGREKKIAVAASADLKYCSLWATSNTFDEL